MLVTKSPIEPSVAADPLRGPLNLGVRRGGLSWAGRFTLKRVFCSVAPQYRLFDWLTAPKGVFILMLRVYWPQESLLDSTWQSPCHSP
jgi:hypothetical protein